MLSHLKFFGGCSLFEVLRDLIISLLFGVVGGLILTILSLLLRRVRKIRKELESLIVQLGRTDTDTASAKVIVERVLDSEDRDRKASFVVLTIEVEKSLRSLAVSIAEFRKPVPIRKIVELLFRYEILDKKWVTSFQYLWNIRNKVIHGMSVTDDEIELGNELAASLLVSLKRLEPRQNEAKD